MQESPRTGGAVDDASRSPPAAVRFAIIGTNVITDRLLEAGRGLPGFSVAAVYSRTAERAAEFAAKHGCSLMFTSLEELATCTEVDAVYIASPTSEHAKQAILLLRHGKHVLCEKPACSNTAELEAVLEAARASGCAFMEAMRSLKTPNFSAARDAVGTIGPVHFMSANFCQLSSRWPAFLRGERPNAFEPAFSNGALMDLGCYGVYAMVALLGAPQKVAYTAVMLPTGVDGGGTLVLQYAADVGVVASLTISKMSQSFGPAEVQGEGGTVCIDHLADFSNVRVRAKGGSSEGRAVGIGAQPENNMGYELEAFMGLVRSGRQEDDTLTWQLALSVSRVLDAARRDAGIVFPADSNRIRIAAVAPAAPASPAAASNVNANADIAGGGAMTAGGVKAGEEGDQ